VGLDNEKEGSQAAPSGVDKAVAKLKEMSLPAGE